MRRAISYWIYILFVLIFVSACGGNKQHSSENVLNDFDSICQRGELRVLTLYSSTSYFIYSMEKKWDTNTNCIKQFCRSLQPENESHRR